MPSEQLSHRLVAFRDKMGLTQADLATALGVTSRYLGYLESGEKDIEPSSSLYKWFTALENGQVPLNCGHGSNHARDQIATYGALTTPAARGARTSHGLTSADVLSQVRADLAMIEGGTQHEKRRAFHFLYEVHLPMLAKMLQLES